MVTGSAANFIIGRKDGEERLKSEKEWTLARRGWSRSGAAYRLLRDCKFDRFGNTQSDKHTGSHGYEYIHSDYDG
jgi:hypothetical protein